MGSKTLRNVPSIAPVKFWEVVNCGIRAGQEVTSADDNPWQRASVAIRELLADEPRSVEPALIRFMALIALYRDDALSEWTRPSAQATQAAHASPSPTEARAGDDIHPAVIDVAATMRLSGNGKFPQRKFLAAVRDNVITNYREFNHWDLPTTENLND